MKWIPKKLDDGKVLVTIPVDIPLFVDRCSHHDAPHCMMERRGSRFIMTEWSSDHAMSHELKPPCEVGATKGGMKVLSISMKLIDNPYYNQEHFEPWEKRMYVWNIEIDPRIGQPSE